MINLNCSMLNLPIINQSIKPYLSCCYVQTGDLSKSKQIFLTDTFQHLNNIVASLVLSRSPSWQNLSHIRKSYVPPNVFVVFQCFLHYWKHRIVVLILTKLKVVIFCCYAPFNTFKQICPRLLLQKKLLVQ